jgi:hypothetical protein
MFLKKFLFNKLIKMDNKRGLSDIVITLIIVLLSLVAIGVVWFVVNGLIQSGTEGIQTSTKCLNVNLEITSAVCADGATNQTCNVTVKRTGTEDDALGGVKVVFQDTNAGVSSSLIDVSGNVEKIVGKNIQITNVLVSNDYDINSVSVTPYFEDESGKEQLCSQTVSYSL